MQVYGSDCGKTYPNRLKNETEEIKEMASLTQKKQYSIYWAFFHRLNIVL